MKAFVHVAALVLVLSHPEGANDQITYKAFTRITMMSHLFLWISNSYLTRRCSEEKKTFSTCPTDYGYTGDLDHAVGIVKARYLNQSDGRKVPSEHCPVSGANRLLVVPIVFQSGYVDGQFSIVCGPPANDRFDRGFRFRMT